MKNFEANMLKIEKAFDRIIKDYFYYKVQKKEFDADIEKFSAELKSAGDNEYREVTTSCLNCAIQGAQLATNMINHQKEGFIRIKKLSLEIIELYEEAELSEEQKKILYSIKFKVKKYNQSILQDY